MGATTVSLAGSDFSISDALKEFFKINPMVQRCLTSKDAAESMNTRATKLLYRFLKNYGLEPRILVGTGFKKKLSNVSSSITRKIAELGGYEVRQSLSHAVVKVNDMCIDVTHLRLGDNYEPYSFPHKNLQQYWESITDMSKFAEMSASQVRNLVQSQRVSTQGGRYAGGLNSGDSVYAESVSAAAPDLTTFTWFRFRGLRKTKIVSGAKTFEIQPKGIYGVKEYTRQNDRVILMDDISKVYIVEIAVSEKVMARSSPYKGKVVGKVPAKTPKIQLSPVQVKPKPAPKPAQIRPPLVVPNTLKPAQPILHKDAPSFAPKPNRIKIQLDPHLDEEPDEKSFYTRGVPIPDVEDFDESDDYDSPFRHNPNSVLR